MEAQRQIITDMVQMQKDIQQTKIEILTLESLDEELNIVHPLYDVTLHHLRVKLDFQERILTKMEDMAERIFSNDKSK
jgi:hypothetical protein